MSYKCGFIGLGNMGFPMAERILSKFGSLTVYNRSQERCLELKEKGAVIATSPGELSARSDVIFLCLPGPKEVTEIIGGSKGVLENGKEGQYIIDFSTVSPLTSREMSEAAAKKGITYIDVPVSGGGVGAKNGRLSLMIGAVEDEVTAAGLIPYLKTVGSTLYFIGNRGGGSAIKIINNFMAFTAQIINGEAILMADHLGIPLDIFYSVVSGSSGVNGILNAKKEKVISGDLEPGFVIDLVMKDLELARQLCQDSHIPNFTLNTGIQFYRMAQQMGYGKKDSSGVIKMIRELEKSGGSI